MMKLESIYDISYDCVFYRQHSNSPITAFIANFSRKNSCIIMEVSENVFTEISKSDIVIINIDNTVNVYI